MNFAELRFWGWLFLGLAVIGLVRFAWRLHSPESLPRYDRFALISLGLFLLLCVSWLTFVIWLVVALGSYYGLKWLLGRTGGTSSPTSQRHYLWVFIPIQLLPLLYYKYSDFALNRVMGLGFDSLRELMIPVGLSFYTFQKVAFVLDTLAFKEPLPRLLDYMNFAGFFPQIVAGPIERKRDLLPQMERFQFQWNRALMDEGVSWVTVGLFFKCCLADNLARWMPPFMVSTGNPFVIWIANVLFGLRIYYDFAGYSLIAYGLARCLGIRLTLNFLSPYCSTSIQEFWRRWHVTLSNWFRDYAYIPLGGGRVPWWAWNVGFVFVVSGLWHGAGWNFVFWGAVHGVFLIAQRLARNLTLPKAVAWLGTMYVAFLAWLCFYETRFDQLCLKLKTILDPTSYSLGALRTAAGTLNSGEAIVLGSLLMLAGLTLAFEWLSIRKLNDPYAFLRRPLALAVMVVLAVMLAPGRNNAFIYFAF